ERLLRLTDRLRHKLAAIRLGLGTPAETTTALATAATPAPAPAPHPDTRSTVERIAEGDASLFDDIERLDAAPFLTEARLRRLHPRHAGRIRRHRHDHTPSRPIQATHARRHDRHHRANGEHTRRTRCCWTGRKDNPAGMLSGWHNTRSRPRRRLTPRTGTPP